MAMQGAPRPAPGMKPQDYYFQLVRNGMSPYQAYQAVQASFGPPPSAQDRAKEQAKNQQMAAIAGTVGTVAGALGTKYVIDNAGKWIDQLTGKPATPEVVSILRRTNPNASVGTVATTSEAVTQTPAVSVNASSDFQKYFTPLENGKLPSGQSVPEGMTGIRSNVDGSVQVVPTESLNNQSFLSDVNWGKVAQGGAGVLQLYQSYKSIKEGDKVGAGIYGVGGASNLAASGALGQGASSFAGEALGGYLVPGANIAMGGYGAYKTAEATGEMPAGKQRDIAASLGGAGAGLGLGLGAAGAAALAGAELGAWAGPIGMLAGAAAGFAGSKLFGSHKGKAQVLRDNVRSALKENNLLDQNYQGTLADGSLYDFGKDGSTMKWKEIDKIAAANPSSWNSTVPLTDALAASYGLVGQKASDVSAWYAKAAVSNAQDDPLAAIANAQHFARQQGITFDLVKSKLDEALAKERINQNQYDYYLGGAQQLTAGIQPQPQQSPQQQKPWQQSNVQPMPRPRL